MIGKTASKIIKATGLMALLCLLVGVGANALAEDGDTSAEAGAESEEAYQYYLQRDSEFSWEDYEASLAAAPETTEEGEISAYALSDLSTEQQNIVRRAEEQANVAWTPLANISSWNGSKTFQKGTTYYGVPYGQPVYQAYVPWVASLTEFSNAVNNLSSKMYTQTGSYGGVTFPYYSSDCSSFVSWAWGLSSRQTTRSLSSYGTLIGTDLNKIQVGDIFLKAGVHTLLVEDVTYQNGELVSLTTIEQTPPIILRTVWGSGGTKTLAKLQSTYLNNGYTIYRSNKVTSENKSSSGGGGTDSTPHITYQAYQGGYNVWFEAVSDGEEAGITGKSRSMEAMRVKISNASGGVSYRAQCQGTGWSSWASDWSTVGSTSSGKRIEAVEIKLTGEIANNYDVYYRVHCQTYGWLGWAKNGESAGTEGLSKRMEAIEIKLVKKGGSAPGSTSNTFVKGENTATPSVEYKSHSQTYGWESSWVQDGATSGVIGESKRMEAIYIRLKNTSSNNHIQYQVHCQTYGWLDWVTDDSDYAGLVGKSKRLEAIRIKLSGDIADSYDIYYRVHCQTYGWLGWAKNGEDAGTEGLSKRMEAIEIKLVKKGEAAPGSTENHFINQ